MTPGRRHATLWAVGIGAAAVAGVWTWLLHRRRSQVDLSPVVRVGYDQTASSRVPPITILATYREPDGQDYTTPITLHRDATAADVERTLAQLATCILRGPDLGVPTRCWLLRVNRGDKQLSHYERDPNKLATSVWILVNGVPFGRINELWPRCSPPFCTNDERRIARGSTPCT